MFGNITIVISSQITIHLSCVRCVYTIAGYIHQRGVGAVVEACLHSGDGQAAVGRQEGVPLSTPHTDHLTIGATTDGG